jgi:hypothetical protein
MLLHIFEIPLFWRGCKTPIESINPSLHVNPQVSTDFSTGRFNLVFHVVDNPVDS